MRKWGSSHSNATTKVVLSKGEHPIHERIGLGDRWSWWIGFVDSLVHGHPLLFEILKQWGLIDVVDRDGLPDSNVESHCLGCHFQMVKRHG